MPSLCVPWTLDYVATLGGFMPGLNREDGYKDSSQLENSS